MSKKAKQLASMAKQAPLVMFIGRKIEAAAVASANYQMHKCTACHTEVAFAEVPGLNPFCPSCGQGCAPVGADPVPVTPQEDLLTAVGCPHCQTQNVVEDRLMDVLAGVMHCGACGHKVSYKSTAAPDLDDDDKESVTDPVSKTVNESDEGEPAGTAPGGPDQNDAEKGDQGVHKAVVNAADEDGGDDDQDQEEVDLPDGLDDDDDVEVKVDDDGFGEEAKLLAFVGGVHAYTLVKANAGENADLMTQKSFHNALQRETASNGHRALTNYGFTPVKVSLSIKQLVNKRVQAALTDEQAKVQAKYDDVRDNFEQCAKIATAALTQGFYKHRPNPLKDQLIAQLEGMGFKQAKIVVTKAIASAGPAFVTAMLELADELMDKSVDHRNELSDSLTEMAPEQINADIGDDSESPEHDEDKTSPEELTARLHSPLIVTKRSKQTASVAGASMAAELRALKNL